jgi:hypothetical protein
VWPCKDKATKDFLLRVVQNRGASRVGAPELSNQRRSLWKTLPFWQQAFSIERCDDEWQLELCSQGQMHSTKERTSSQVEEVDDSILGSGVCYILLPVVYLLELEAELQNSLVKAALEPSVPLGAIVPLLVNDAKGNVFVRRAGKKANDTGVLFTCWRK